MQTILIVLVSRVYLFLIAFLGKYFPISTTYPDKSIYTHGFALVPQWFLDIWFRWDSGWYLNIIKNGYRVADELGNSQAFFPLYPILVKWWLHILPLSWRGDTAILIIGLVIANVSFVTGMCVLHKLIQKLYGDRKVADYAIYAMALFPTSFIFSAFYSESLFLLLSVITYYYIIKEKWLHVAVLAGLLTLTRPTGIMILIPVLVELMTRCKYKWQAILAMIPSILAFIYVGQSAIGAQMAWGKTMSWPWTTILSPTHFIGYITSVDKWISIVFLILVIIAIRKSPRLSFTWYGIAMLVPFLFTGTLQSATRYCMLCYPLIAQGSYYLVRQKNPLWQNAILHVLLIISAIFFIAWVRFYWVT